MITSAQYKIFSDSLANIQDGGIDIYNSLINMSNELIDSTIKNDPNGDQLYDSIVSTSNLINKNDIEISSAMIRVVKSLQLLIEENISPINNYLFDNNILVKCTFANMSYSAGFPIDLSNIEDPEYCILIY